MSQVNSSIVVVDFIDQGSNICISGTSYHNTLLYIHYVHYLQHIYDNNSTNQVYKQNTSTDIGEKAMCSGEKAMCSNNISVVAYITVTGRV